jgi:hypothetical protein
MWICQEKARWKDIRDLLVIQAIQSVSLNCLEIKDLKHGLKNCGTCTPQLFRMIYCQHITIFGTII